MTYRGRSDGLVVETDRKKCITFTFTCCHLRDLQGYCVYTSGGFFFSFPPRQCVAPIALMNKPPLIHTQTIKQTHTHRAIHKQTNTYTQSHKQQENKHIHTLPLPHRHTHTHTHTSKHSYLYKQLIHTSFVLSQLLAQIFNT